ncbi:MAG: GGDEF domain-containing protein [Methylophilus sp.]
MLAYTRYPPMTSRPPFLDSLAYSWGAKWGEDQLKRFAEGLDPGSDTIVDILRTRCLTSVYQPIVSLNNADIYGFEGLIRGPADTSLYLPLQLFEAAKQRQYLPEMEHLSRQIVLENYAATCKTRKLFLNSTPEMLLMSAPNKAETMAYIASLGLEPQQIIIEVTEQTRNMDYGQLREAVQLYRDIGFEIAMDDLGEGFSSLRLWSELKPDYVKIDKHFIRNIHLDQVKFEFVRSIQQIAQNSGAKVIAEGIETFEELSIIKDLKIDFCQGYYLGRPEPTLIQSIDAEVKKQLVRNTLHLYQNTYIALDHRSNVSKLLKYIPPIQATMTNNEVMRLIDADSSIHMLPVVDGETPIGLITRYTMIDNLARPYRRELYGNRRCAETFMDTQPLIVEKSMSLKALSDIIAEEAQHFSNGFIITDNGRYLGIGRGQDLLREVTLMQINAARYANPITLLPGNVPINEQLDRLLASECRFSVCYFDLDTFKPYNDIYGFRRGDEIISYTAKLLLDHVDQNFDFVGHIGGDDFIVIFQSKDWQARCKQILSNMENDIAEFYDEAHKAAGGVVAEDRQGKVVQYPFVSLSIGAVKVKPGRFRSQHELSSAVSLAKKQAKKMPGNSLFIERRA